ncbi:MAG TPA: phosphatase PAP2 family protein [Caulobacteraceae bacterium]|nr:phosphatase PAP2 family protein [Caulobacteraceae bacterium]
MNEAFARQVRSDWGFYAFIFGYAALVGCIAVSIGEADKFVPLVYYPRWIGGLITVALYIVAAIGIRSLFDKEPGRYLISTLKSLAAPQYLAGLLLFMTLALYHGVFTSMKTMLTDFTPFHWDPFLANLDAAIHGRDAWLWLRFLEPVTSILRPIYGDTWFLLIALIGLLVCTWPRLREVRSQYIWTFLLAWSVLGNFLAGVFMSGGPIFYQRLVGDDRFAGIARHLETLPGVNPERMYPNILWTAYTEDRSGFGTGISAFPSMHLSMATLFVLFAFRVDRRLGFAMLAYLVVIMAGSVHLGWHYGVDGYFSIAATVLIWKAVGWAQRMPAMQWGTPATAS